MLGDFLRNQEKYMFASMKKMDQKKKQVSLVELKKMEQFKTSLANK